MFDKGNKDTGLLSAWRPPIGSGGADNDLYPSTQQFVTDVLWTSAGR